MIVDGIGLTIDSFEAIYTTGGTEVLEIYAGLNYTDPVYSSDMTIVGCPPLLFTANGRPLKDYTILGNSYQNGTPTPEDPIEVQSVGDRTKNLFDKDSTVVQNAWIKVDEGRWRTASDSRSVKIPCSGGTTYTIATQNAYPIFRVAESETENAAPQVSGSGTSTINVLANLTNANSATFSTAANAKWIIFQASSVYVDEWMASLMLNTGSAVLPYEPYGYKIPVTVSDGTSSQIANIYLDEPLRKIGGYADKIDYKAGTVRRKIDYHVFDGSESFGGSVYSASFTYSLPKLAVMDDYKVITISNMYVGMSYNESWSKHNYGVSTTHENVAAFRDIRFPLGSDPNEFKQFLSACYSDGNPLIVYYVLRGTITKTITLPTIPTINGQNTLTVDTTVQPSSVSITGHIKPNTEQL